MENRLHRYATFVVHLRGKYYAIEMPDDVSSVKSLDKFDASGLPEGVPCIRTAADRDRAIMACAQPYDTWREAYDVARAGGHYAGELIPADGYHSRMI